MKAKNKALLLVSGQFVLIGAVALVPANPDLVAVNLALLAGNTELAFLIGNTLLWPGFAILAVSLFALGSSLTASPIPRDDAKLVTGGLYRFMRHPIYSGLLLATLGVAIERGPLPHLLIWLALLGLLNYKAAWEEKMLLERFPEYRDYQLAVPRFLPRPWRAKKPKE